MSSMRARRRCSQAAVRAVMAATRSSWNALVFWMLPSMFVSSISGVRSLVGSSITSKRRLRSEAIHSRLASFFW